MTRFVCMLLVWYFSAAAFSTPQELGEVGIDDFIASRYGIESVQKTQLVVDMDDHLFDHYLSLGSIHRDTLLYISRVRIGVPYVWGGNNWLTGVDCSHFTMKVFQDIGAYYKNYQMTRVMKDVRDSNGYYRVDVSQARFGDMLVYGGYERGKWVGHVVILIDEHFARDGFRGLVVGSHGYGVGVQFISYKGFPHYYRRANLKLHNVLRNKHLAKRMQEDNAG